MKHLVKHIGIFLLAFCLGTLYALMIGMLHGQLRAALIAWPIHVVIFWLLLAKFRLYRFIGFVVVPPVSLLAFQLIWSVNHHGKLADDYLSSDRSHYTAHTRKRNPNLNTTYSNAYGWNQDEIMIGADGFRADPVSGRGNPERCRYVLIGDSMIYGSGLAYSETLGPQLARLGIQACVFGVTGNSPAEYLSTLNFVANRIEPGAYITFYIYAYNDFIDWKTYLSRRVRASSGQFQNIYTAAESFDRWRRTTVLFTYLHAKRVQPAASMALWRYDLGDGKLLQVRYPDDPQNYNTPKSLTPDERGALELFFAGVATVAKDRSWRITMTIHPDHAEIYANLALRAQPFTDLDPRRAEALAICKNRSFRCDDISRMIYEKAIADGKNPYFTDDRHFSPFGTSLVAQDFAAQTKSWDSSAVLNPTDGIRNGAALRGQPYPLRYK